MYYKNRHVFDASFKEISRPSGSLSHCSADAGFQSLKGEHWFFNNHRLGTGLGTEF